jgi:hypothetical protein
VAAEARLVAARVRELVDRGACTPGDVVVLLRAVANLAVFERALQEAGFATLPSAGRGWWGRREVLDLTAHLGALGNPRDELALLGLLASPLVGLSSDALALLAMAPQRPSRGLWGVAEDAFCGDGVGDLLARLPPPDSERLAAFCPGSPPSGGRHRASPWTSCSSARSPAAATTCTSWPCPTARGGWPTCASCSGWPPTTRRAMGATCAASSTTRAPSWTRALPRPTRRSRAVTRTRCGS